MNRMRLLAGLAVIVAGVAYADVQSVMRTDQQWQCTAPDGTVVAKGSRDDVVFAACSNAVSTTKLTHKVVGASFEIRYIKPAVPEPEPAKDPVQPSSEPPPAKYVALVQICSDTASVGATSCAVQPTRFEFPTAASIVKSDGVWSVFGSLAATANVLVCSLEQAPGSAADPFRELCQVDAYVQKSAVRLSPTQPPQLSSPTPALPVTSSAKLSWVAPTTNTDGSALTDLAGYRVLWGTNPNALDKTASVGAGVLAYEVKDLPQGTYTFAVKAYNAAGTESAVSKTATKTIQ